MPQNWFSTPAGCLKELASMAPSHAPDSFGALATIDGAIARARTVVLSGVAAGKRQLWFASHSHAHKMAQIKKHAASEITFWLSSHGMVQLRLLCDWRIVSERVCARNAALKKLRRGCWLAQRPQAQALYGKENIGAPLPPADFEIVIGTVRAIDALAITEPHAWVEHTWRGEKWTTRKKC